MGNIKKRWWNLILLAVLKYAAMVQWFTAPVTKNAQMQYFNREWHEKAVVRHLKRVHNV